MTDGTYRWGPPTPADAHSQQGAEESRMMCAEDWSCVNWLPYRLSNRQRDLRHPYVRWCGSFMQGIVGR